METLLHNKKFISASVVLIILLSLFVAALFMNEVKSGDYVGRGSQPANVISVSGKGEVHAISDIATLSFSVSKDGLTAKDAQALVNTSVTKVLAYLKDQKIDTKDITSQYGGLEPKYETQTVVCMAYPCTQKEPKIIGYTATQSMSVKIRDVDTANTVRTGLASVGVTNIYGPTFSIDNADTLNEQARSIAIIDARKKAEVLARELGVELGHVVSFTDGSQGVVYPMMAKADAMSLSAGAPAAPELPRGDNTITSNVTITYEIR